MQANTVRSQPLLIYDGDCAFCVYWARYWQRLTGDRVDYAPYQEVAPQYPEIPVAAFQRAVQYVAPDGKIASGAEASFLTLSHASGKGFWLMLYRHLPGFRRNHGAHLRFRGFAPWSALPPEPVVMGARL